MISELLEFLKKIPLLIRQFIRVMILIIWVVAIAWFAGVAAGGGVSKWVLPWPSEFSFVSKSELVDPGTSPRKHLDIFLSRFQYPPPLEAMIDQIIVAPSWSDRDILKNCDKSSDNERKNWLYEKYSSLFNRINNKLQAVVADRGISTDKIITIQMPLVPDVFKGQETVSQTQHMTLPDEVVSWIKEERLRLDLYKQRSNLVDTYVLVLLIGAFGSLIFLIRDYIERQELTSIASLIFRPILGMFLAMAVFIFAMFGQSMVSTAKMDQARPETLYLLALAAGLLSEEAYNAVVQRAKKALENEVGAKAEQAKAQASKTPETPPDTPDTG